MMQKWVDKNGVEDRQKAIQFAKALSDKYGEAAASYACDMYDAIATSQNAKVTPAVPADTASWEEVGKAINGSLKQSIDGNLISGVVERLVKQAGEDTMLQNAARDRAEFAWIPDGGACAFCIMLASRGWQRASKELQHNHAEHIHANCGCEFAIRFDKDSGVIGYNPDALKKMYDEAAPGKNSATKMKALRSALSDKNNALNNIGIMNRAVKAWTYDDLNKLSKSDIINMNTIEEIQKYFGDKGIILEGFDKLNIDDIKAVLAGVDDGLKLMPEAIRYIETIKYNPRINSMGVIDGNTKTIQFGKKSFHDWGSGIHEVSHAYDFSMTSRVDKEFYSEKLIKQACDELNIKVDGTSYQEMAWDLAKDTNEYTKKTEIFAYAIESQYGMNGNELSKKIVELLNLGKLE